MDESSLQPGAYFVFVGGSPLKSDFNTHRMKGIYSSHFSVLYHYCSLIDIYAVFRFSTTSHFRLG